MPSGMSGAPVPPIVAKMQRDPGQAARTLWVGNVGLAVTAEHLTLVSRD